ncbi:ATP synthase F1 subunit epsilon [bacterium]|nr:ATP synthase F1 subunit epsilon [bacterium]
MAKLNVRVLSPETELASVEASEVSIPALYGYMGLRPAHAPIIAQIGLGTLEIKSEEEAPTSFFVSGGYFELLDDQLTLLVDTIERSHEIDVERVGKSVDRAIDRLNAKSDLDVDISRALASLERAKARKHLAEIHSN